VITLDKPATRGTPVKIAILLLNQGRGSGEVARQHARHLIALGHEIHFIHPRVGEGVAGAHNHDVLLHTGTMPVHEYLPSASADQKAVSRMGFDEAAAYLPVYEAALEKVAAEVDLFIGHHANLTAVATARVARRAGKPYALFLHGTGIEPRHEGGFDDRIWELIEDAIRGAAGILVTTDYVRDELVRPIVDLPVERFLVLPCGVDLEEFRPGAGAKLRAKYELPADYVICPGALTAMKGPQNVVEASRAYSDLAPTVFIGDGELRAELESALGERGRFLGFVPAADKAALICGAAVLAAAPEKREHFGIIYAEALAGGTLSAAYEGGGVGSIITPEVGRMAERSPAALGAAVRELLSLPGEERERMTKAARERAEALYDYPKLVAGLDTWLEGLVTP
jgi:glycosyltransferase involved in cell wall biosynthesis